MTDVQVQVTGRIKGHHTRADGSLPFLGFKHALYAYLSKLTVAGRQVNVKKGKYHLVPFVSTFWWAILLAVFIDLA